LLDLVLERGDLARLLAHRLAHHLAVLAKPERHQAAAAEDADDLDQLERGIDRDLLAHRQHPIFSPVRLCTRTWRTVSAVSRFDEYVIARHGAHCALAVVAVVPVVTQ